MAARKDKDLARPPRLRLLPPLTQADLTKQQKRTDRKAGKNLWPHSATATFPMASQNPKPAQAPVATAPPPAAAAAAGEAPPNPASSTPAQNPTAAAGAGGGATDLDKKMRRAERFGTPVVMSEEEKRSNRAERFGTGSSNEKMEEQKRKSRAERFGIPSSSSADEDAKKKARLERFGQNTNVDKAEEEKRKARALRFAETPSGSSEGNGKDNSKPDAATVAGTA